METSAVIANRARPSLRTLIAFAAARSYSANTNNPLNSVLPLFEPIAAAFHGRPFSAAELSRELADRYDLIVSEELCGHWATQLVQQELLIPIANAEGSGGHQWSQERVANAPDGAFADELAALLDALRGFSEQSGDLITSSLTDEQIVSLLRRGAIASMFPRLHENNNPAHRSEDEYVFSRFVAWANSNDPKVVDSIARLRKAAIYSDLILHLREPRRPSTNIQNVFAYLDSPLVMDLVGLGGKLRQAFAARLIRTLKEMKIVSLVSPVMVDEIKGNIKALLKRDPRDRFGPTADALRKGDFRVDYVEACHDRIEMLIEDAGIQIDRGFSRYLKAQYDEAGKNLEEELLAKLQSHYRMFGAAERDAESLFGCFGRRDGLKPRDMYSSRCFFVTSNDMLAAVGNKFFREHLGHGDSTFPIIVTRSTIAAMADAISGVATKDSMTEQELIISAADATSYDPVVFDKIETLLKTITPDEASDLSHILQRTDVSQLAMDLVRGNANNVTSKSVSEIVSSVKNRLDEEAEKRVAASIERERQEAAQRTDELSAEIKNKDYHIASLYDSSQKRHAAIAGEIIKHNKTCQKIVHNTRAISAFVAIVVALIVGAAVYLLSAMAISLAANWQIILAVVAALGSSLPLVGMPSVRAGFATLVEKWQARTIGRRALSLGYELPPSKLLSDDDLRAELDRQFASTSQPPESSSQRTSLFD